MNLNTYDIEETTIISPFAHRRSMKFNVFVDPNKTQN